MSSKKRSLFTVFAFNLLFFLALLELTGLVDYFLKTREIYYFSDSQAELLPKLHSFERQAESHRLHPYLGFVLAPSPLPDEERAQRGLTLNNYGFGSPHNYPYAQHDDELIVGFFGGSVAAKLERFEREHGIITGSLATALDHDVEKIKILSFAQGGFKQPQQLLIYNYFRALGQRFDVVLNIDGFNEIALSDGNLHNGVAVEMPSMAHMTVLRKLTSDFFPSQIGDSYLEAMLGARASYQKYSQMHDRLVSRSAWESRFAAGFFIDRKLNKVFRKRFRSALWAYQELSESRDENSWLYLNPPPADAEDPQADGLATTLDLWAESSAMLHAMQAQSGGFYLHFVQPNQYHKTGRVFSEQEATVAFDPQSPYAEPIRRGYPRLREEVVSLAAAGVPVVDLLELFDDLEADAYVDNCCHYTDTGEEVLSRAIARVISSTL